MAAFLQIGFRKVKSDAGANQLVALARSRDESLSIKDGNLLPASLDKTCTLQLMGGIRDAWPLDPQHIGKKVMGDGECILVAAVAHHEEPTREPFFEAMGTVARHRYQDLLQKWREGQLLDDAGAAVLRLLTNEKAQRECGTP